MVNGYSSDHMNNEAKQLFEGLLESMEGIYTVPLKSILNVQTEVMGIYHISMKLTNGSGANLKKRVAKRVSTNVSEANGLFSINSDDLASIESNIIKDMDRRAVRMGWTLVQNTSEDIHYRNRKYYRLHPNDTKGKVYTFD